MNETDLIQKLTSDIPRRRKELILGVGDDASIIRMGKKDILISCDSLVENVHFRKKWGSWRTWGAKAAGAALSDIAAMGGIPKYGWIALGIPRAMKRSGVLAFYRGFENTFRTWRTIIAGGNIAASPQGFHATTTVWGFVTAGRAMRRDRARPGEKVFLSGPVGRPPFRPQPKIEWGRWLVSQKCRCCIDISDGLLKDLNHIAKASRVKIILNAEKIPHRGSPLGQAITGGEDYQLAFTLRRKPKGKSAAEIGRVTKGKPGVVVLDKRGSILKFAKLGFEHPC